MNAITKITYPCPADTMGDCSEADALQYREWFAAQLSAAYPSAEVEVTDEPGRIQVELDNDVSFDDEEVIDSLRTFGERCWNNCPWDWL